jgi:hypothetical protein
VKLDGETARSLDYARSVLPPPDLQAVSRVTRDRHEAERAVHRAFPGLPLADRCALSNLLVTADEARLARVAVVSVGDFVAAHLDLTAAELRHLRHRASEYRGVAIHFGTELRRHVLGDPVGNSNR